MPVRRLSQAIIILLSGYAGLCILDQVIVASSSVPPSTHLIAEGVVNLALLLILLATGVCFLIWMHRLDSNLRAFGVEGLRYTPGWGVASFFIPIMSLYRPYQVLREIWQASGPKAHLGLQWRMARTPLLLVIWWASFLLMNIVEGLAASNGGVSSGTTDIETVTNVAAVVSALLAIIVVRLFTARQENTAAVLSLST